MSKELKQILQTIAETPLSKFADGCPYQAFTCFQEKAQKAIEILDKKFEFIFQGTYEQFEFFQYIVSQKIPGSMLFLDNYIGDEFHCSMNPDPVMVFKMGMVTSACYAKFGRLEGTKFSMQ